ncbi:MAG: hypothetical protein JWN34_5592 [Bryobacterales bacterium]|nr:hypothetical protein [Bryobacterales bacterium]
MSQSHSIFGRQYPASYDAIVVGAGIGGLFCANLLAKGGLKVLLLEKHSVLGGFCSGFRRKGYLFDAATHFYPLLGNSTTLSGRILKDLGVETEWIKMDPVDQFHLPGMKTFAVPAEFGPYIERLKEWFPDEAPNVDAYFQELRKAHMYGLLYYFRGVANDQMEKYEKHTIASKLDEHFHDPRLKTILMGDAPHWGSSPDKTSYVFDAMLRLSYFLGNYYPKGSSQQFANDLGTSLERLGGRVIKCASVENILIEGNKVKGVRVQTVSKRAPEYFEFQAPVVVSNADAVHTYRDLMGEAGGGGWMVQHLESLKASYPCFLVHMGLKGMDEAKLAESEGYYWSRCDPSDIRSNVFKIFVPTRFDSSIAPPGCQVLIVQRPSPHMAGDKIDWAAHKEELFERTLSRIREELPGIDEHIVTASAATAVTSQRFTGNWQGGMLGWEMSPEQLGPSRLPMHTPVDNLYLTGHWTQPGGGITPVIVSAQRVAKAILTGHDDARELSDNYFRFSRAADSLLAGGAPEALQHFSDMQVPIFSRST